MNDKIKAIFFDLDGTLLPMDEDEFTNGYFGFLCKKAYPFGYDKDALIKTVWGGTKLMWKNDGVKTNEEVFWNFFKTVYGEEKLKDKEIFNDFYTNEFKNAKIFCGENAYARQIIDLAKSKNLKLVLSSNPVFPRCGMISRMGFVGLNENDFDYITSYENSHYCKPNPKYFEEILNVTGLKAEEVILFGNSEVEDIEPSSACGIKGYLIGDCVKFKSENSTLKVLTYPEVLTLIKTLND